jgi:acyl-coenzyme A synthetase/AMP-(fatty) acid ligase
LCHDLNFIPFVSIGEIYVGGTGLTSGYLNRSELTDTTFITNPFTDGDKEKIYKTGDLGRYRADGCIEFLGRVDQQVKIRGHRIELDEVENSILAFGHTEKIAVTVEEMNSENQIDVSVTPEAEELTKLLKHHLNESEVDELLTSIGSLNRIQKEHLLQKTSNPTHTN